MHHLRPGYRPPLHHNMRLNSHPSESERCEILSHFTPAPFLGLSERVLALGRCCDHSRFPDWRPGPSFSSRPQARVVLYTGVCVFYKQSLLQLPSFGVIEACHPGGQLPAEAFHVVLVIHLSHHLPKARAIGLHGLLPGPRWQSPREATPDPSYSRLVQPHRRALSMGPSVRRGCQVSVCFGNSSATFTGSPAGGGVSGVRTAENSSATIPLGFSAEEFFSRGLVASFGCNSR